LIISNACSKGCEICYRDCAPNGTISDLETVKNYILALNKLNVFEIVIGGGDILSYPYLFELLDYIKIIRESNYINFTSRVTTTVDTDLVIRKIKNNPNIIRQLAEVFDRIAFTVSDSIQAKYIRGMKAEFDMLRDNSVKLGVQLIPEYLNKYTLSGILDIMEYSDLNITLLGLKNTGRAKEYKPYCTALNNRQNDTETLDRLMEYHNLSVDTQFLINFPDIKEKLPKWSYRDQEGVVSCCIDATNNTIAPSSYSNKNDWIKLKYSRYEIELANSIKNNFAKF